jgi:aryl carrier-like protein
VAGEIAIGGSGVARGYLGQPELTARRFVEHPYRPGERLYRSGDLGRWRADGRLEILGRLDDQVKVRGVRIEPAEVREALLALPGVRQAAVVGREIEGATELVAYVAGRTALDAGKLRQALASRLPAPMIPAHWMLLDALPLNANGKVDLLALPAPAAPPRQPAPPYQAPRDEIERRLAAAWEEVLGRRPVGAEDDFFALGGDSLKAIQVASRIRRELGAAAGLTEIFRAPTVRSLAALLAESQPQQPPEAIAPAPPADTYPLSAAQRRLWTLDQLAANPAAYNVAAAHLLEGPLRSAVLARCLAALVDRHEALRSRFFAIAGEPRQQIAPAAGCELAEVDLRRLPDPDAAARREVDRQAGRPFDLAGGPPLRLLLLHLAAERHVLAITLHHIAGDGWSLEVMSRELGILYDAFAAAAAGPAAAAPPLRPLPPLPPLPPVAVQPKDHAVWQRARRASSAARRDLSYWRERLGDPPPPLDLPADRPRPASRSYRGAAVPFVIAPAVAGRLADLRRRHGASSFVTLLAAATALFYRYTGQQDLILGTVSAGRERPELQGVVGCLVDLLPLRLGCAGAQSFGELLAAVRRSFLEAHEHRAVAFDDLVEELRPPTAPGRAPWFDVGVTWNDLGSLGRHRIGNLRVADFGADRAAAKYDLIIAAGPDGETIRGAIEYSADLFDRGRIERTARHLASLLEQVSGDDGLALADLELEPADAETAGAVAGAGPIEIELNLSSAAAG